MELVTLPRQREGRRQRRRRGSNERPLLFAEDDRDEFLDEWLSPASSRWRRRTRPLPMANVQGSIGAAMRYQPPARLGVNIMEDRQEHLPDYMLVPELYFNGPAPPSASRALRSQTPSRTTGSKRMMHLKKESPALDVAGFFSYGFVCMQCVRTQEVGISENFGRFDNLHGPGFYCMMWPFSDIAGRLSLRIQQLDVLCETKTKDNVFVHVRVSVQFRVIMEKAYDAYYRLTNPGIQIKSYVFDVLRSTVPKMRLDAVFLSTTTIAQTVWKRLHRVMQDYGYEIMQTLVTDVSPDPLVKASMNEMNASKKLKEAMPHQAEAEKIRVVKAAEASAEAMYLSGVGSSNERKAIAMGLKDCVHDIMDTEGVSSKDVMDLLLITQYIDTLCAVGANDITLRCDPGEAFELLQSLPTSNHIPDLLS